MIFEVFSNPNDSVELDQLLCQILRAVAQGHGKRQLGQHDGEIPALHTLPAAAPGMEVSTAVSLHLPTWKAQQLRAAWGGRTWEPQQTQEPQQAQDRLSLGPRCPG